MQSKFSAWCAALVLSFPGVALATVIHDGVAFSSNPGGGSTVYLHQNGHSGSGKLLWALSPNNQPLSYSWTATPGLTGSTAVFDQGEVILNLAGLNGMFDAVLKLGTSGVDSQNTLSVGGVTTTKSVANTPAGSVDLTHGIGGALSFELADGNDILLASGLFEFDDLLNMGPFNKVGNNPSDVLSGIVAYIWGGAVDDNLVFADGCAQEINCERLMTELNNTGLGFDFSFTGVASVPEPKTWMLLLLGLTGMAWSQLQRRRGATLTTIK